MAALQTSPPLRVDAWVGRHSAATGVPSEVPSCSASIFSVTTPTASDGRGVSYAWGERHLRDRVQQASIMCSGQLLGTHPSHHTGGPLANTHTLYSVSSCVTSQLQNGDVVHSIHLSHKINTCALQSKHWIRFPTSPVRHSDTQLKPHSLFHCCYALPPPLVPPPHLQQVPCCGSTPAHPPTPS